MQKLQTLGTNKLPLGIVLVIYSKSFEVGLYFANGDITLEFLTL